MITESNKESIGILVSMIPSNDQMAECERNLEELASLFETAGGRAVAKVIQVKSTPEPATLIGSGKVDEIALLIKNLGADIVIFDLDLSPAQIRNLEDAFCVDVIDRSMLVLDIFALHAVTGEGKLQVELAQLKYSAPRLIGNGSSLSRQGGGIGSRGPGESKLETDKRHLKERIHSLEVSLKEMEKNRLVMRNQREKNNMPEVAIVGYTNAGKSTLLNYLTNAGVLSENKLFATLDPTTRRLTLPSGTDILLTDTVGFIRKLPHQLVEAFKSTLDEVRYADILLLVADMSAPDVEDQIHVTLEVIEELGAKDTPILCVYNKCDVLNEPAYAVSNNKTVFISAKNGDGVDDLLLRLDGMIRESKTECLLRFSYQQQSEINQLYQLYSVESVDYREDGIYVKTCLDAKGLGHFGMYRMEASS